MEMFSQNGSSFNSLFCIKIVYASCNGKQLHQQEDGQLTFIDL
jgi:hypothetical protein